MSKFKVIKRLSLKFLGKEWEKAYIDFQPVTIGDIKNKFPEFSAIDEKDQKATVESLGKVLDFLQSKFISGKAVLENGSLADLKKEELEELPAEVLSRALSFLSQGVTPT